MHGEYKIPGGKLVVVDFAVNEGCLVGVRVSGDFFLEPDSALDLIDAALNGSPVNSTQAELIRKIEVALDDDVVLYGISADGVAVAVRRAIDAGDSK